GKDQSGRRTGSPGTVPQERAKTIEARKRAVLALLASRAGDAAADQTGVHGRALRNAHRPPSQPPAANVRHASESAAAGAGKQGDAQERTHGGLWIARLLLVR